MTFHTIYSDNSFLSPIFSQVPPTSLLTHLFTLCFSLYFLRGQTKQIKSKQAHMFIGMGNLLMAILLKESDPPLSKSHHWPITPQLGLGPRSPLLQSILKFLIGLIRHKNINSVFH